MVLLTGKYHISSVATHKMVGLRFDDPINPGDSAKQIYTDEDTDPRWSFEALGDGRYLIKTTEMITCFLERKIIRCVHPMPNLLLEWERMDPVNGLWRKSTRAAVFIRFINLTHPRDGRSTAIGSALHSQVIPMATGSSSSRICSS